MVCCWKSGIFGGIDRVNLGLMKGLAVGRQGGPICTGDFSV